MAAGQLISSGEAGVVLLYHGVTADTKHLGNAREMRYWLGIDTFQQHLDAIEQMGCGIHCLKTFWTGAWSRQPGLAAAILTFDDGLVSDYEAVFPLLQSNGITATFFLNTANVGRSGYLAWPQISEMARGGMSFQSHSHEHVYLNRLSQSDLDYQLGTSKRSVEDRLGQPVDFLSAPYGELNAEILQTAFHLGYRAACSSSCRPALPGATVVDRVPLYEGTTRQELIDLLSGKSRLYRLRAVRGALVGAAKKLVLPLCWERIQARDQRRGL